MTITPEELEAIKRRHEAMEAREGERMSEAVWPHRDRATLLPLAERCLKAEARVAAYEAALDPDKTKAAYIGEFGFYIDNPYFDEDDIHVDIPWTVIKAIMRAISDRAAKTLKDT